MIKKKKKKNRILITLCAMFLAVASVFAFIPFAKNDTLIVKADTISDGGYTFEGSRINVIFTPWDITTNSFNNYYSNIAKDIGILPCCFFSFNFSANSSNLITEITGISYDSYHRTSNSVVKDNLLGNAIFPMNIFLSTPEIDRDFIAYVDIDCSKVIDNSIYLGVPVACAFEIVQDVNPDYKLFCLHYYDINNNSITFKFFINSPPSVEDNFHNIYHHLNMPYRKYYFSNSYNFTDNEYYDQGYDGGYRDGLNEGYNNGYAEGNDKGYNNGYNVGYNNGYSEGVEDTNQYSFLNLVSATIDAPIKYFQSLFNFELLGVNLQGFLTGLFTLCVIVTIIKMVL